MNFEKPNFNNSEEKESFQHQEILRFQDGETAITFRTPGDVIEWSKNKYFQEPSMAMPVIIETSSGNEYIAGGGIIVNKRENTAKRIEEGLPAD
ncbi:MAG: hypothetical protein WDZ40_03570 [Candidatus Spechtbacterales bacterium]